jgi:hypothetical protein
MVHGENALKSKTTTFRRVQHIVIVAALIAPLVSLVSAPAQAVAPTCAQGGVCTVGDIGPGGGIVFYVAPGSDTFACGPDLAARCRYLEAAPNGWSGNSDDPDMTWSSPSNRTTAVTGADETAVGSGYKNSEDIKNQSGNLAASSAAVTARAYSGGGKSDWYLPSKDELNQMCKWVRGQAWVSDATLCNGTGNMNSGAGAAGFTGVYWSSTEVSADKALSINFLIGYTDATNVGSQKGFFSWQVRPIRAFSPASLTCAQGGVCEVGDTGPGGGIVFYVAPTTFTQIGASGTMCTTNCKYLEAARISIWGDNSSDPAFAWTILANQSSAVTGANGTAIGTGYQNSVDILNQSGAVIASSTAATAARAFSGGSKSDWYLPSIEEMAAMVPHVALLQLSTSNAYWSSSEDASQAGDANFAYFGTGLALTKAKSNVYLVRTIRAFAPSVDSLVITRASVGTQRGTAFTTQPQITLRNFAGETATASSAVVTATISAGGTLIGTTTATASSGIATFTNLGVNGTVGSRYTITYSATGLVPTSATIALSGTTCDGATFTCQVGDTGPGGGKIFYVAPTTFTQLGAAAGMCSTDCKYLEAAPTSGTNAWTGTYYQWSGNLDTAIGTTGTQIGTGYSNTVKMVTQSATADRAGTISRAYRGPNNLTDWFLPSQDELNELYVRRASVGGFVGDFHWSSSELTENPASIAWFQSFESAGSQLSIIKFSTLYVRPIRAFASATKVAITRAAVGTQRRTAFTTQPQVTIQFSNNETVTASSAVVTATISSGGTLVGTTTATASSGVATFSNLGVDGTIGTTYTISYTALDLPIASATVTLTGTTCDGATFTCQVGDTGPGGGTIFYVAPTTFTQIGATGFMCSTACKYLEAAPTSGTGALTDAFYRWSGNINTLIGTTGTEIGTGYKNTLAIVAQSNTSDRAATVSRGYSGPNSLRDWFLPSKDELNELYLQKTIVGGFQQNYYWSSSESNTTSSFDQNFTGGSQGTTVKDGEDYVRPIRAFGTVPTSISVYAIGGVTAPVSGATPVSTVTAANGYTGTVTWSGSPTTFASSTIYTATITLTAAAGYTLAGVGANSYTVAGATSVTHSADSGIVTAAFPATGAPTAAPVVVAVAPTPVPYLKTLTTPKLRLSSGKLLCTPGTYNAGYTLDGVIQGSTTTLFTPSSFTYNLLINGITQTSLAVTSSSTSQSWNMPTGSTGALVTCSVAVTANGITNTDKSGDNTSGASSALTTQSAAIATANATYAAALAANTKAYQKAIVDNRAQWRSATEKLRTDYYAERDRIRSLPSTKATRALSSAALKAYTAALKKSAADYKASGPAALSAKDAADKTALDAKTAAIAKANAAYGTAIESIGYGVLIP